MRIFVPKQVAMGSTVGISYPVRNVQHSKVEPTTRKAKKVGKFAEAWKMEV
jgi:hypothetical protein